MDDTWLIVDIFAFTLVVLLTGVLIPQILLIAFRKQLFDAPDPRKIHKVAVPRLGGIAFFPAVMFTITLLFGFGRLCYPSLWHGLPQDSITGLCFLTCATVTLYLVGMADDLIGLRYRAKFVAQIIAAALIIAGGIRLADLHGLVGINAMPAGFTIGLTILLTVFITNAINLIDGIDGLASGLSAIACAIYGYMFFHAGLHIFALLSFATLGALVPFFWYNVFGDAAKHGKIFMGDTGSLTIGLMLSVLSIRVCAIDGTVSGENPAVVAFAPLLIPCLDVVRVYIHRIRAGRNAFLPDKTHIHHKLLALGMTQKVAMPTIIGVSLVLSAANCVLSRYVDITLLFILDIALWITANMTLSRAIRRRELRLGRTLYR